jgi:multiple sugar transport system substrate-binding protein
VIILLTTPAEYAARSSLTDITDFVQNAQYAKADAIFEGPLASCKWKNKIYGLPSSAGAGAIFINVAKFKEKGIPTDRESFPKTWDELRKLSKEFVVQKDGAISEAGFVPFIGNAWLYPVWSALNGGQIYDSATNTYKLDSDNNVQWLDYWVQWLDEQYGGNLEAFTAAGNWADAYNDGLFAAGQMAAVHSGSWVATDADIPFEWEAVKFPFGPSGSKSVTGFYPNWWVLPAGVKHPKEAFLFIEFIATIGWETWYKYILDTPSWKNFPPDVLTDKLVKDVGKEKAVEINSFFASYLNDSIAMWDSPIELFAQQTIGNSIGEVLNKKKTAKVALAEAQQICQTKLQEVIKA